MACGIGLVWLGLLTPDQIHPQQDQPGKQLDSSRGAHLRPSSMKKAVTI
jgi:hypothetical protein